MVQPAKPLYGRFEYTSLSDLIGRLRKVAMLFPEEGDFSTYLTTFEGERFYGLDYAELEEAFTVHTGKIQALTSTCGDQAGKSVTVTVRFRLKEKRPDTQFVIVAPSVYQRNQLKRILEGTWVEPSDTDQLKALRIGEVLLHLKNISLQREAQEAAEAKRLRLAQQKQEEALAPPELSTIRDAFRFNEQIPAQVIIELAEKVSELYLDGAPFYVRVIASDGEPYANVGLKGLRIFLDRRRKAVRRVLMDAATPDGTLVDMVLSFGESRRPYNAELEITAHRPKKVQALVRKMLEYRRPMAPPSASMVHEMFRFEQESFSLDATLTLIQSISHKYLDRTPITAFLSTQRGQTYPSLSLKQLRNVFQQHESQVSFLLLGINQAETGHTFSLMFQFQAPGHDPYGSLSMMWDKHEIHQAIRALIWEQLKLKPYHQAKPLLKPEPEAGREGEAFRIDPVFVQRKFEPEPLTAMLIMPLEAYWSESLWMHLQNTLRELGYECMKAQALFSENTLEDTWTSLNEVELVIADLTYKHPDVFYKIGVAHTLGKRILLITQHARDLPGDFKRFPHVVYDNNLYGLKGLSEQIKVWLQQS